MWECVTYEPGKGERHMVFSTRHAAEWYKNKSLTAAPGVIVVIKSATTRTI